MARIRFILLVFVLSILWKGIPIPVYAEDSVLNLMKLAEIKAGQGKNLFESDIQSQGAPIYGEDRGRDPLEKTEKPELSPIEIEYRKRLKKQNTLSEQEEAVSKHTGMIPAEEKSPSKTRMDKRNNETDEDTDGTDSSGRNGKDISMDQRDLEEKGSPEKGGLEKMAIEKGDVEKGVSQQLPTSQMTSIGKMKSQIKLQLEDLKKATDKASIQLKSQLKQQLLDITFIEAKYNEEYIKRIKVSEEKKFREISLNQLYPETIKKMRPLPIPEEIFQFGYDMFNLKPSAKVLSPDVPVTDSYIIGSGDKLIINLSGALNDQLEVPVETDGTIDFLNGPTTVAGLPFGKVRALLARIAKEKVVGVTINVNVTRLRMLSVFIMGDVQRPGACMVSGMTTVSGVLLACGGAKKNGSLRNVQLLRNGKRMGTLDMYDLLVKGDTSHDLHVQSGDVVLVAPIMETVAIAGDVNRPAIYEINSPISLGALITLAGGLRPTSLNKMAQIEHIGPDGVVSVLDVDINKPEGNIPLANGDLVKVFSLLEGEAEENLVYVLGNVKRPGARSYTPGMRVSDVITNPVDLMAGTYLGYALIEREAGVERESSLERFSLEKILQGDQKENPILMPRDRIYIFPQSNFHESGFVEVDGLVQTPGKFELKRGMRVVDLILLSGGFRQGANLAKAELYHFDSMKKESSVVHLDLSRVMAMDERNNLELHEGDRLVVHAALDEKPKLTVTVLGEVNYPGQYPYVENATLADIVFASGGLTDNAYRKSAELMRYEVLEGEERRAQRIRIELTSALSGDPAANIKIFPYDQLIIRKITGAGRKDTVKIEGEVRFPGEYPIQDGETLADLIILAGGYTNEAFPFGAQFTRKAIAKLQEERFQEMANKLEMDAMHFATKTGGLGVEKSAEKQSMVMSTLKDMAAKLRNSKPDGRMVVDIANLEILKRSGQNLKLVDGDSLHIPRRPDSLMIFGGVYNPNVFVFSKKLRVSDYVAMAGGYTEQANTSATYIIRANGEVVPVQAGFFRSTHLGPGDAIVVPEKLEELSTFEFAKDFSQILYQLAVTTASLKTLSIIK